MPRLFKFLARHKLSSAHSMNDLTAKKKTQKPYWSSDDLTVHNTKINGYRNPERRTSRSKSGSFDVNSKVSTEDAAPSGNRLNVPTTGRTRNVKTAPTTPTLDSRDPQQASPSSPVSPHSSSSSSSGSASGGAAPHGAAPSSSTISSTTYTPQTGASPGGTASNAAGSDSAGLGGASSPPASARGGAAEGGTPHTGAPAPSGQDHGDQGATLGPMTVGDMPANCQRTARLPHKGSESDLYEKVNGVVPMGRLPSNKLVNNLTPRHKNSKVNEKFHRIFRRIPEEELVINAYSCAYFGDILLQGYLYISPNYFCFYSKILSHEKMIEIDVAKVLNITRERTAFIIPNAIGVKTRDSKYVFGSLMSRDNTYKLMWTAWKKVRPDDDGVCEPPVESSDSDAETCSRCGEVLEDRTTHTCNRHLTRTARSPPPGGDEVNGGAGRSGGDGGSSDLDQSPDSGEGGASSSSASRATPSLRRRHHSRTSNSGGAAGGDDGRPLGGATSNSSSATGQPHPQAAHNFNLPYLLQCANFQKLFESIKQLVGKIQSLPRTCVLLAVCTILVIFLLGSAVIMTSKIMLLQSRLDDSHAAIEMSEEAKLNGPSLLYKDTYYLNNQYHIATVEKLHTVLQANIQLLAQVHKRLQSLNAASEGTTDPEACATPDT